ncbi:hypothetical protein DNTS_031721 [Danionella cerebrum]|uniref:Ig-like domain-containing protein n=1 Tax=Danionella cerebrum TaxID=2873325 RepID=A0A553QB82_9TELE|nr:hypothetical protein DNTS_031721 [Danionella translucida]
MLQTVRAGSFALLVFHITGFKAVLESSAGPCPSGCSCSVPVADCSGRTEPVWPLEQLPSWISRLDLSRNRLRRIHEALLPSLKHITELNLSHNELESIPDLGQYARNLSALVLSNNRILGISAGRLSSLTALETLDLSNNLITEIPAEAFPQIHLKNLCLNNNRISTLELGCFSNLSSSLLVLKLNKNRLNSIPPKVFTLPHLQHLDLSRNRVRRIEGLVFQGLQGLLSLRIQRNGISRLMDGAFWGLANMEELQLEFNNLTEVSKGWLYGLLSLQRLLLSQNAIVRIRPDAWEFCQRLTLLDLSWNQMSRLEEASFVGLSVLEQLHIGNNRINFIADGAFRGLVHLQTLDLEFNEISWTIEDMNGPFSALDTLRSLFLQGNHIRSVTRKSFSGLDELQQLDLSNNAIMRLNSSSLLCDCQLKWFPAWVAEQDYLSTVNSSCAHPLRLKGQNVIAVGPEEFVCHDFPKPEITVHPESHCALRGANVSFSCVALSSSDSPVTFAWKKDQELLSGAEILNQAHVHAPTAPTGPEPTQYSTTLTLRHVQFVSEGRYQCVISNHFGSSYSSKARLTVNILPFFTKTPMDLSIRAGATARLECAASGHPAPQIAWQKDGGTDFPAARERRMHVMPRDDVFFIVDVKTEDIGIYSCTAQNAAGSVSANATLTVLETPSFLRPLVDHSVVKGETAVLQCIAGGSPPPRLNWTKDDSALLATERHFFAAANKLLIIVDAAEGDAGTYTCLMSNPLGTARGNLRLAVLPNPNCDTSVVGGASMVSITQDGWTTVGIVIIAVVCCVVGTSLVWVVIIYHTRRRNEDCSVTNTDETNLPADIPSFLSSQGTLMEPHDGFVPSEGSSLHHCLGSSMAGLYMAGKDFSRSEEDMEAAIDPLVCHCQRTGSHCSRDSLTVYSGSLSRTRPLFSSRLNLEPFEQLMQIQLHSDAQSPEGNEREPCGQGSLGALMGTFGKTLWRSPPDYSNEILQKAQNTDSNPSSEEHSSVYEQPFDSRTIERFPTIPLGS